MTELDTDKLTDIEELQTTLTLYERAKEYLENFSWCVKAVNTWIDPYYCIGDKVAVFLFKIEPLNEDVDDYIWIIVGDLPSVYLDKSVLTPKEALTVYCELMEEWANNIKNGQDISDCYPVIAKSTKKNAQLLTKRIEFIRKEILMIEKNSSA